jgi:threonine/homoserine/homoserine lactone efflux protein
MIESHLLFPYLFAAMVCILSPGADSLGTLTIGISRGQKPAMAFAAGVGTGCLTHTLWAAVGVATIVAASETLFSTIKYLGAAYLLWIGIKAIRAKPTAIAEHKAELDTKTLWKIFISGLIANSLNPKVMLFFIAFLPQFVSTSDVVANPIWVQMLILGVIFSVITGTLYVMLGFASGSISKFLQQREHVMTWINRFSGMVFIGLALKLALTDKNK